jgi:ABC-type antimicrobial peptide transport system permease subunit
MLLNLLKNKGTKIIDIKSVIFSDMKKTYENNKNKKPYVSEFKFNLDKENNTLHFESDDILSIVTNVSAKSIKSVYEQYGKNCGPLYGSNLRYHINNKKIDDDIRYSIKNYSKEF